MQHRDARGKQIQNKNLENVACDSSMMPPQVRLQFINKH